MSAPMQSGADRVETVAKAIHAAFVSCQARPQDWPTWGELLAQGHQGAQRVEDTRTMACAAIRAIDAPASLDPLAPARGILHAVVLSVGVWAVVTLVVRGLVA